jgi:cell division protein FtsQ
MRKNYYKNSTLKKSAAKKHRLVLTLKAIGLMTVVAGMSLAFVLCYDLITQHDYFNAQKITVSGAHRLSSDLIIKQTHIQKGINILSINLSKARKNLLAHPWIEEADVSRKLPNEIIIHIKEHQALAVLDLGRKFIINTHGVIFKELGKSDPDYLPIITGLQFSDINVPGTSRSSTFEAVMTVLALGQQQGTILPNKLIKRIHVDREMGLTLHAFAKGKLIKLGYHDYPGKYENLKNILYHMNVRSEFTDFASIDLNNLHRIVVDPVKAEPSGEGQKEV